MGKGLGETHNPAEGEEGMRLHHATRHVAAVVALADELLVAGDGLLKGFLAEDEEEEHDYVGAGFCR